MIARRKTPATSFLLAAIIVGFIIEIVTGAWVNGDRLSELGAIVPAYITAGEYWRLLSAMFLHGDGTIPGAALHLGFNCLALYQLGSLYEIMFGTRRFLFIYFTAGIVASITSFLRLAPFASSVGASGAIFGILGAFIFSVRRSPRWRTDRVARSIVRQLIFFGLANIAIGMSVPKIDLAAHLGGLVTGLLLGALLPHNVPPAPPNQMVIEVMPNGEGSAADPAARRDDR